MNQAILSFVLSVLFLGSDVQAMAQEGNNPLYTKNLIICASVGFAVGVFSLGYWFGKSVEAKKQSVINQGLTQDYQESLGTISLQKDCISQQKSENTSLKKEIQSLERERNNLRTQNTTLISKNVDLEYKLLQLKLKNSSLRSEGRRLKDQNKSLCLQLETQSFLARSYKRIFERNDSLLKGCNKENIRLRKQLLNKPVS